MSKNLAVWFFTISRYFVNWRINWYIQTANLKRLRTVWHSSLTQTNKINIERVKKSALKVILGPAYESYRNALKTIGLLTLEERRENICKTFAEKSIKNSKHKNWFKVNKSNERTRKKQPIYCNIFARTKRFESSPISYLTKILNKNT